MDAQIAQSKDPFYVPRRVEDDKLPPIETFGRNQRPNNVHSTVLQYQQPIQSFSTDDLRGLFNKIQHLYQNIKANEDRISEIHNLIISSENDVSGIFII